MRVFLLLTLIHPIYTHAQTNTTHVHGYVRDPATYNGIENVDLEARILSDTTKGFDATTDNSGYFSSFGVPITSAHQHFARPENNTLEVIYEQGQIRFKAHTSRDLREGKLYTLTGQEIHNVHFEWTAPNTFEAVWENTQGLPPQVLLFSDGMNAAKIAPWMSPSGMPLHQSAQLNTFTGPQAPTGKKAANADGQDTTYYKLSFRHPEYQPLDSIMPIAHNTENNVDFFMTKAALLKLYHSIITAQDQGVALDSLDVQMYDALTSALLAQTNSQGSTQASIDVQASPGGLPVRVDLKRPGYEAVSAQEHLTPDITNTFTYDLIKNLFAGTIKIETTTGEPLDSAHIYLRNAASGDVLLETALGSATEQDFSTRIAQELLTYQLQANRPGYDPNAMSGQWVPGDNGSVAIKLNKITGEIYTYLVDVLAKNKDNQDLNNIEATARDATSGVILASDNSLAELVANLDFTSSSANDKDIDVTVKVPGYERKTETKNATTPQQNTYTFILDANRFFGTIQAQDDQGQPLDSLVIDLDDANDNQPFIQTTTGGATRHDYDQRKATEAVALQGSIARNGYTSTPINQTWQPGEHDVLVTLQKLSPELYDYFKQLEAQNNEGIPLDNLELIIRNPTTNTILAQANSGEETVVTATYKNTTPNEMTVRWTLDSPGYEEKTTEETLQQGDLNAQLVQLLANLYGGTLRARDKQGNYLDSLRVRAVNRAGGGELFDLTSGGATHIDFAQRIAKDDVDVDLYFSRNGFEDKAVTNRDWDPGNDNDNIVDLVEVTPNEYEFAKEATATDADNSNAPITGLELVVEDLDGTYRGSNNSGTGTLARVTFTEPSTSDVQKKVRLDAQGYEAQTHTETLQHNQNNRKNYGLRQNLFAGTFKATHEGSELDSIFVKVKKTGESDYLFQLNPNGQTQRDFSEREAEEPSFGVEIELGRNNFYTQTFTDTWEVGSENDVTRALTPLPPPDKAYTKQARARSVQSGTDLTGVELDVKELDGTLIGSDNSGTGQVAQVDFTDPAQDSKDVRTTVDAQGYEPTTQEETLLPETDNLSTYNLNENRFQGTVYAQTTTGSPINGLEVLIEDITNGTEVFSQGSVSDNSYEFDQRKAREPMQVRVTVNANGFEQNTTTDTWEEDHANNLTLTLEEQVAQEAQFRGGINVLGFGYKGGRIHIIGQDVTYEENIVTTDAVPYHDFTNIPIDQSDGESELEVTVSETNFPFHTKTETMLVTAGDNGFKDFLVEYKPPVYSKRLQGSIILGQTGGQPATGYRVIIRDDGGSVVYDQVVSGDDYLSPRLDEGTSGTISAYFPTNDPQNRDEDYFGIAQAPFTIGEVGDPGSDTLQTINMRFTPVHMVDPYTGATVTMTAEWIKDLEGGSFNRSYWDDKVEDVYLSPEVDVAQYNATLDAIEDYFGIRLQENRVDSPISGWDYGLNIYQDGTGAVTVLRDAGDGTHIGANINITSNLIGGIKERMGRWYEFTTCNTRTNSFMNPIGHLPSIEDRVIVVEYFDHQESLNTGKASYNHYYIRLPNAGGF